jgi:hypothetical protein
MEMAYIAYTNTVRDNSPVENGAMTGDTLSVRLLPGKGFIPNKRYQRELEEQNAERFSDSITDVAYGQYALLQLLSADVLDKLKDCFLPERAAQIYTYGLILCVHGFVHLDQVNEFYTESIMSLQYSKYSFKMGYDALTQPAA